MAFDSVVNREIGLRLRSLREQNSLTRERLAEYADISVQFLADIETGRKGMTVQTLRKLATALHCSADAIVFGADKDAEEKGALPPAFLSLTPAQASLANDILALVLKVLPPESPAGE
ncbi:MAG: helix-turn-helix domain-containing protein [Blautia massiliensis (ex Durand et al. 2017)]|nr:MAG: XRE family transcriptional regulator [Subdoligranulum variabile]